MISHIFIDLDNTLYDYNLANSRAVKISLDYMSANTGISFEELNEYFSKAQKDVKSQQKNTASSHSRLLYFKRTQELIFNQTNIKESIILNNIFWTSFMKNMSIFPAVKKFLTRAKDLNILTTVVTNLNTDIQLRKLVSLDINEFIDFVVTSEDAGSEKPSNIFIEYLTSVTSYDKKQDKSWFIGDDLFTDLEAGKALKSKIFIKKNNGRLLVKEDYSIFSDFNDLFLRLEKETFESK